MNAKTSASCLLVLTALGLATVASSQTPSPPGGVGASNAAPARYPGGTSGMSPEQLKVWNSPTMLRARAWVQEYCQRSSKITPEEANQYMVEMEHMTPVQMKLWLLKFEEEEENIRRQQADFETSRRAAVGRATSVDQATRQAYANINRDETEAAQGAEQSLSAQQAATQERSLQKSSDRDAAATALSTQPLYMGGYLPYGYGGYTGAGDIHYHTHYHR